MRSGSLTPLLLTIALLAGSPAAQAQATGAVVHHQLSFPELRQQYIQVTAEFPADGEQTLLILPSWTPGAYRIRDYAADIDQLRATNGQGRRLTARKVAKDAWRVDTGGLQQFSVTYRVHAAELNPATSYASAEFVLINGPSVFLYSQGSRQLPQQVSIRVPDGLGRAMSPLPQSAETFIADDYDQLLDNPVVIAEADITEFSVDGHDYIVAHVGDTSLWDTRAAAADLRDLVAATNAFWGEVPLERPYWFFNLLVERGGGLEHNHGTVMMASRWQMRSRADYIQWLSLAAHEYFHAWNVRRLRPEGLEHYDYRREQYTPDLWLAEGLTSYYDDLLLSRAGVIEPAEYLDRLARQIHSLELTPGRARLSLRQASRDAWIRQYQPDANAINSTVSYYIKGAVLGFALDARLRQVGRGDVTLDQVLRALYDAPGGRVYGEDSFLAQVNALADAETAAWLDGLLDTPADPDIDSALDWFGLALNRRPGTTGETDADLPRPGGLGINWDSDNARLVVAAVVDGYSAARAGVLPGDELLAINNERVTRASFEDRKRRLREGEWVELLLSRHGRIQHLSLQLGAERPTHYEIGLQEGFGRRELRRMGDWLGQELALPR